jgi:hypothetical protein
MADVLSNIPYDDLVVDERYGPYEFAVSEELAGALSGPIGEDRQVTWAPPAVFPVLFLKALREAMGGIPAGSILAKQDLEFHGRLRAGSTARVTTWVGEKYVRRERPYVVIEFDIRNDQDGPVLTGRKIIVWPTGPGEAPNAG